MMTEKLTIEYDINFDHYDVFGATSGEWYAQFGTKVEAEAYVCGFVGVE